MSRRLFGGLLGLLLLAACGPDDLQQPAPPTTVFHIKEDPEKCDLDPEACIVDLDDLSAFEHSKFMRQMGYSPRLVPFGTSDFSTDLAFWGRYAYQGTYSGFRIIDISQPDNPVQIVEVKDCAPGSNAGAQGDIVVWDRVLVRSWDARTSSGGSSCRGEPVPGGFEGLHIFDISNPANPVVVGAVDLPCGSHTATAVPDLANGRLLIYSSSSSSSAACAGIDIVSIPLAAPGEASYLRFEPSGEGGATVLAVLDGAAAGEYLAAMASFGPPLGQDPVTGPLVEADPTDACSALQGGGYAGAIVLIDRGGGCPFTEKVFAAQAVGAAAVVIINNVSGSPISPGGDGTGITIPTVMIAQHIGVSVRSGLPADGALSGSPVVPHRACHDTSVILGEVNLAACAGGNGFAVWSLDPSDGGSLTNPALLYTVTVPGVTIGHSASFTWDGEILVFGHEPGGGGQARCQDSSDEVDKSIYFFQARTGAPRGSFALPRPQSSRENCTWHNFNVVPTPGRYVLVAGNYQSGISVVDFTNPANAYEIAYADPLPLTNPSNPAAMVLGGDWASYWYNGRIYQSDIRRGLLVWELADPAVAGARQLGHLNPQTQLEPFGHRPRPPGRGR